MTRISKSSAQKNAVQKELQWRATVIYWRFLHSKHEIFRKFENFKTNAVKYSIHAKQSNSVGNVLCRTFYWLFLDLSIRACLTGACAAVHFTRTPIRLIGTQPSTQIWSRWGQTDHGRNDDRKNVEQFHFSLLVCSICWNSYLVFAPSFLQKQLISMLSLEVYLFNFAFASFETHYAFERADAKAEQNSSKRLLMLQ